MIAITVLQISFFYHDACKPNRIATLLTVLISPRFQFAGVDCNMLYVAALFFPRHLVNYLLQDFSQLKFLFIFVV